MTTRSRTVAMTGVATLALALSLTACGSTSELSDAAPAETAIAAAAEGDAETVAEPAVETADEPAAEPAGEPGTRANPAAIGQVVTISQSGVPQWEVSLSAPSLDATAAVAAANEYNDAAPAGMVFASVIVNVKRLAEEAASPGSDLTVEFVTAAGTTHNDYDISAYVDGDLSEINEMYTPATAAGVIVIAIPVDNAAAGTWTVSSMFGDPTFFKAV